jgi:hypothetical protein
VKSDKYFPGDFRLSLVHDDDKDDDLEGREKDDLE